MLAKSRILTSGLIKLRPPNKVRSFFINKIKAANNSRLCFIYATYLSYTSTQDVKNLGIISKLCDVNITNLNSLSKKAAFCFHTLTQDRLLRIEVDYLAIY